MILFIIYSLSLIICLSFIGVLILIWILDFLKHLDSPDNNPDLPWEFSEANKKKVIYCTVIVSFNRFSFQDVSFGIEDLLMRN